MCDFLWPFSRWLLPCGLVRGLEKVCIGTSPPWYVVTGTVSTVLLVIGYFVLRDRDKQAILFNRIDILLWHQYDYADEINDTTWLSHSSYKFKPSKIVYRLSPKFRGPDLGIKSNSECNTFTIIYYFLKGCCLSWQRSMLHLDNIGADHLEGWQHSFASFFWEKRDGKSKCMCFVSS